MKIFTILMLVAIVASLFSALFFVYKDRGTGAKRSLRALMIRVGLSVSLFVVLMIATYFTHIRDK
jgi:Protein of unknown function (DUF2909)